jgi:hypothetical protein
MRIAGAEVEDQTDLESRVRAQFLALWTYIEERGLTKIFFNSAGEWKSKLTKPISELLNLNQGMVACLGGQFPQQDLEQLMPHPLCLPTAGTPSLIFEKRTVPLRLTLMTGAGELVLENFQPCVTATQEDLLVLGRATLERLGIDVMECLREKAREQWENN